MKKNGRLKTQSKYVILGRKEGLFTALRFFITSKSA